MLPRLLRPLVVYATALVVLLALGRSAAAEIVAPVPAGWSEASEVRERADAWAVRLGARVTQVATPMDRDGFAETLAILEIPGPMSGNPADQVGELEHLARALFGDDAELTHLRGQDGLVAASYAEAGLAYQLALASSGASRGLVVMEVKLGEEVLYHSLFERVREGLTGIAPGVRPFPLGRWRAAYWIGWLAVFTGLCILAIRRDWSAAASARWFGAGFLVIAALIGGLGGPLLVAWRPELASISVTPIWAVTEALLAGIALFCVFMSGLWLRERRLGPVRSAPAVGSFVVRGQSGSALDLVHHAVHPDGRGELSRARERSGRSLESDPTGRWRRHPPGPP